MPRKNASLEALPAELRSQIFHLLRGDWPERAAPRRIASTYPFDILNLVFASPVFASDALILLERFHDEARQRYDAKIAAVHDICDRNLLAGADPSVTVGHADIYNKLVEDAEPVRRHWEEVDGLLRICINVESSFARGYSIWDQRRKNAAQILTAEAEHKPPPMAKRNVDKQIQRNDAGSNAPGPLGELQGCSLKRESKAVAVIAARSAVDSKAGGKEQSRNISRRVDAADLTVQQTKQKDCTGTRASNVTASRTKDANYKVDAFDIPSFHKRIKYPAVLLIDGPQVHPQSTFDLVGSLSRKDSVRERIDVEVEFLSDPLHDSHISINFNIVSPMNHPPPGNNQKKEDITTMSFVFNQNNTDCVQARCLKLCPKSYLEYIEKSANHMPREWLSSMELNQLYRLVITRTQKNIYSHGLLTSNSPGSQDQKIRNIVKFVEEKPLTSAFVLLVRGECVANVAKVIAGEMRYQRLNPYRERHFSFNYYPWQLLETSPAIAPPLKPMFFHKDEWYTLANKIQHNELSHLRSQVGPVLRRSSVGPTINAEIVSITRIQAGEPSERYMFHLCVPRSETKWTFREKSFLRLRRFLYYDIPEWDFGLYVTKVAYFSEMIDIFGFGTWASMDSAYYHGKVPQNTSREAGSLQTSSSTSNFAPAFDQMENIRVFLNVDVSMRPIRQHHVALTKLESYTTPYVWNLITANDIRETIRGDVFNRLVRNPDGTHMYVNKFRSTMTATQVRAFDRLRDLPGRTLIIDGPQRTGKTSFISAISRMIVQESNKSGQSYPVLITVDSHIDMHDLAQGLHRQIKEYCQVNNKPIPMIVCRESDRFEEAAFLAQVSEKFSKIPKECLPHIANADDFEDAVAAFHCECCRACTCDTRILPGSRCLVPGMTGDMVRKRPLSLAAWANRYLRDSPKEWSRWIGQSLLRKHNIAKPVDDLVQELGRTGRLEDGPLSRLSAGLCDLFAELYKSASIVITTPKWSLDANLTNHFKPVVALHDNAGYLKEIEFAGMSAAWPSVDFRILAGDSSTEEPETFTTAESNSLLHFLKQSPFVRLGKAGYPKVVFS